MSAGKNRTDRIAKDTHLIAGLEKHHNDLPPSIVLSGQARTPAACILVLHGRIDGENQVLSEQAALLKAQQAQRTERTTTDPFVHDLKVWLLLTYGNSPEALADFGVALPRKSGPKTAVAKVVAAAKSKATREARHTASKKAKAKIHGVLTGPVVVADGPLQIVQQPVPAEAPGARNGSHA